MSTEQNKAVVRRFITEVLADGNTDHLDEFLLMQEIEKVTPSAVTS